MKHINDVRISSKLFLAFLIVLTFAAAVGIVALVSLTDVNHNASELADNWLPSVNILGNLKFDVANSRRLDLAYLLLGDNPEERARNESEAASVVDLIKKHMAEYEPLIASPEEKKIYLQFKTEIEQYLARHDRYMELGKQRRVEEARGILFGDTRELFHQASKHVEELMQARVNGGSQEAKAAHASYASTRLWIITGLAVAVVLGLLLALSISRLVGIPLRHAAKSIVTAAAEGNLCLQLEVRGEDEVGQICSGFNGFLAQVHGVMVKLAQSAEHVAGASEEIAASATQMANGGETQRDQVHQVATAMQQMSATVHEVSENCNKASESAHKASQTAREGGMIVENTLTLMRSIADSVRESAQSVQELGSRSDRIGKIVGVIDDIADQTNLLALNAAIEAARAGEQGRGFAVVADEVRKLAERTTKATKEIAEMIQSVQAETRGAVGKMQSGTQQVEKGVEVTAKAGASLKQIIGQAEHVGEMVTQIATAANEQLSATEQVSNNVEQIKRLVAESAEGAQQSAKACEQLSSLALELQNLVSRFKLGQQTGEAYHSPRQAVADPGRVRTALALAPRPGVRHVLQAAGQNRNEK